MSALPVTVSFSDLTHTGHSCNAIPYGVGRVAAYALKNLGDKINVALFKHPADFIEYLNKATPKIACFSNYVWNTNLSSLFAGQIKKKSPDTITIFGGPNYPLEAGQQKEFLLSRPEIDFYIYREGEPSFVELFSQLSKYNFDISKIKKNRAEISNCHYIDDGEIVRGRLMPPLKNLDEIPSPYLSGLFDKFLDKELMPLLQIVSGCPFNCTYCQDADKYFSRIRRFSSERIKDELEYIAERTIVPNLLISDTNFGMYEEDLEICREIALIQKKYKWPKYFSGVYGKNQKERLLKAASIVRGAHLIASVQSTDEQVLKNIRRKNFSLNQMIELAKNGEALGANSFSEIILCLPGDTKVAHFKSNFDLIDACINTVRSHQFIMLPGSEASTMKSRKQYGMVTRFRVAPNTVKPYQLDENAFFAPEIDEICVSNNTMPFEDYLECRQFNLTVEIFYNDNIFQELLKFLNAHDIPISSFIMAIHRRVRSAGGPLSDLYDNFLRETKELWESREELEAFLQEPGVIERYRKGELGNNEQLIYRAMATFKHTAQLHRIAFGVAGEMLKEKGLLDEQNRDYLRELSLFSLLRKQDILSTKTPVKKLFQYDFVNLAACNFSGDPLSHYRSEGINILFSHTDEQRELISEYIRIYGSSNYGLGNILSNASHVNNFYRKVTQAK